MSEQSKKWDVFISHTSEDKDTFVRPLAVALRNVGVSVWYDEFSLRLGNSLSRSIDRGLANSRFGLVVISSSFLKKPWPEYELRGLVAREIEEDRVILPIWHGVTRQQVLNFSPPLADKVALNTRYLDAQDIALQLLREIRPDIYSQHPRSELERLASGDAIRELQEEMKRTKKELETVRGQLSEYRCPYCGADLIERLSAPADPDEKHWDTREIFHCGYQCFGGFIERPCPKDPHFPRFGDYKLHFYEMAEEIHWKWQCHAIGRTDMARRLHLSTGYGKTREEAEQHVRDDYDRQAARGEV